MKEKKYIKKDYANYGIIFIVVVLLILVGTSESPLFKGIGDTDSAVFQVMGRGLLKGQVMYKDLFDHKGPIVYFINAIAYIISPKLGVLIIETLLTLMATVFMYKIARIALKEKSSLVVSLIYLLAEFKTLYFGNFTEEYAITFMNIALYYMARIYHKKEHNKKINWIIIGLTFAINFFIKPTYISVWIAFGIVELIICIKNNKIKELAQYIGYMLIGVLIITIPILIYLVINNDIKEFIDAYFIMNQKYSNDSLEKRIIMFHRLFKSEHYYIFLAGILLSNVVLVFNKSISKTIKSFVTLFYIISFLLLTVAANKFAHYLIQFAPLVGVATIVLLYVLYQSKIINNKIVAKLKNQLPLKLLYVCTAGTIIISSIITSMKNCILTPKLGLSIKYKEEVNALKKYIKEDDEVLVLGNDSTVYILLDKQPQFKYFFQTPIIRYDDRIISEVGKYITEKRPAIIVIEYSERIYGQYYDSLMTEELKNNYNMKGSKLLTYMILKEKDV